MNDRGRLRVTVLRVLVVSLLLTLGARLWVLQVLDDQRYRKAAVSNRVRDVIDPATRGLIVDDEGRALVRNRTSLVISVDRSVTDRQRGSGKAVLGRLAAVVGVPLADIEKKIRYCTATVKPPCWNGSPYQPIPVVKDVTDAQALAIIEHPERFPGVSADLQAVRQYPYGPLAAHEVGYLAPVTTGQLASAGGKKGYHPGSLVGAAGVEATYDSYLRGTDGVTQLAVDRFGRVSGTVSSTAPVSGDNLVLSLDVKVQKTVEQTLQQTLATLKAQGKNATTASAVVLNTRTGGVVAMASLPSYDPSVFTGGISEKDYQALTNPANGSPLVSRVFAGSGAPGSTFKIVSLSTGVSKLGQPLDGSYACPPTLAVGNQTFHNFEGESAGSISLHQAVVISCDVIFDKFAYDAWLGDGGLRSGRGPYKPAQEAFVTMARAFGFGRASGLDVPGETTGAVVDRAGAKKIWQQLKGTYCRRAKTGYPEVTDPVKAARFRAYAQEACIDGFLYNGGAATQFAIGQGQYLSVSPLQLAIAYAAVANGGTVFHPTLAKAIVAPDGTVVKQFTPSVAGHLPVSAETLAYLRDALHGVTTEPGGTASGVFADWPNATIPVGGKTGTAEVEGSGDTSWFASFAPSDDPQYVVVVSVPNAGQGANYAAPAAKAIYQSIYGVGQAAALPGGVPPKALPRTNPDGTISPPGASTAARASYVPTSSALLVPTDLAPPPSAIGQSPSGGTVRPVVAGVVLGVDGRGRAPPPLPTVSASVRHSARIDGLTVVGTAGTAGTGRVGGWDGGRTWMGTRRTKECDG